MFNLFHNNFAIYTIIFLDKISNQIQYKQRKIKFPGDTFNITLIHLSDPGDFRGTRCSTTRYIIERGGRNAMYYNINIPRL